MANHMITAWRRRKRKLMGNSILIETFWHPVVKENRTLIGLNHMLKLIKIMLLKKWLTGKLMYLNHGLHDFPATMYSSDIIFRFQPVNLSNHKKFHQL